MSKFAQDLAEFIDRPSNELRLRLFAKPFLRAFVLMAVWQKRRQGQTEAVQAAACPKNVGGPRLNTQ